MTQYVTFLRIKYVISHTFYTESGGGEKTTELGEFGKKSGDWKSRINIMLDENNQQSFKVQMH